MDEFDPMRARSLCGACHQWGFNPPIKNGICTICDRTEDAIYQYHGLVFIASGVEELRELYKLQEAA